MRIRLGRRNQGIIGRAARALLIGLRRVLIEAPLRHVAVHIVQPPRIGFLESDLVIFIVAIARHGAVFAVAEPAIVFELFRIVAEGISGVLSGPAGVFPLGLGGQAIIMPRLRRQPFAVHFGGKLRHADGRKTFLAHAE